MSREAAAAAADGQPDSEAVPGSSLWRDACSYAYLESYQVRLSHQRVPQQTVQCCDHCKIATWLASQSCSTVQGWAEGCLLFAAAPKACRRPPPCGGTLACLLGTLLGSMLSLRGLLAAAAAGKPPREASAWLHAHLASSLMQRCAGCARAVAEPYWTAAPDAQQVRSYP